MISVQFARIVSLLAAFVMGAVAEWKLGIAVGMDPYTSALIPATLDVWGFAAFATGRKWHVIGALSAMFAAQTVSHLLQLGHAESHIVALAILVSAIAPGVSFACHLLGRDDDTSAETVSIPTPEPVSVSPANDAGNDTENDIETTAVDTADDAEVIDATNAPQYVVYAGAPVPLAEKRSKADIAAAGCALIRQGYTKTAAAAELGVTRQWLHKCMTETGITPETT